MMNNGILSNGKKMCKSWMLMVIMFMVVLVVSVCGSKIIDNGSSNGV